MTRLFKSIISTLVMLSLVAVLPAKTTVSTDQVEFAVAQDSDDAVFASADVKKKKKKKGKKLSEKGIKHHCTCKLQCTFNFFFIVNIF